MTWPDWTPFRRLVGMCAALTLAPLTAFGQCQIAKLAPEDGIAADLFGWSLSVNGSCAIVGAIGDDDHGSGSGAAYVFERGRGGWYRSAKVTASDGASDDVFGWAVAVTGYTAAVGAPYDDDLGARSGAAYVFVPEGGGTWCQAAKLVPTDGAAGDYFGYSMSLDGDLMSVGAPQDNDHGADSGSVYVFEGQANGTWPQTAKLTAEDADSYDRFGHAVAMDGDRILVGATDDEEQGNYSGSAYVFDRQEDGSWAQVSKLLPDDGRPFTAFAYSLAVSGDVALVGAGGADGNEQISGAAYVFEPDGDGIWRQTAKLMADDGVMGDAFGVWVAVDGSVAVIGAPGVSDQLEDAGAAYVFHRDAAGNWLQIAKLRAEDPARDDVFGARVAIDGNLVILAAPYDDDHGAESGSAYVFAVGPDDDGDGVMDACQCPGDLNKDWIVDVHDLIVLLDDWGCGDDGPDDCPGDADADGDTDHADLGLLLAYWGEVCP